MKRFALYSLLWFGASVLGGIFARFPGSLIRLDLVLLLVLYLGFTAPVMKGGWAVLLIGIATESLASPVSGGLTLSYLVVFFLAQFLISRLVLEGALVRAVWVFLLVLFQKGLVVSLMGIPPLPWWVVGSALLQSVASLVFFPFFTKGERLVEGET